MKTLVLLIASGITLASAETVTLKDRTGRSMTATINGVEGAEVLITKEDGTQHRVPFATLDDASIKMAKNFKPGDATTRVRLTAKTTAMGRDEEKSWTTSWGSYDQDVYHSRSISATVECTLGGGPATLAVQWIGSEAGKASNQGVVKVDQKPITLKPGTPVTQSFAALFVESDAKYVALGTRDREGLKYTGWIVRVISKDGSVIADATSRTNLIASYPPPDLKAEAAKEKKESR